MPPTQSDQAVLTRFNSAVKGLHVETFKTWRISGGKGLPIDHEAGTLSEAVSAGEARCHHKEALAILHSHPGKQINRLYLYAIKRKSQPIYRKNLKTLMTEPFHPLYSVLSLELDVKAFDPDGLWEWAPGADVVGLDRGLIEGAQS